MCLSIPSKILSINTKENTVLLETLGTQREASLDLMAESVSVGEFVLLHVGYVISKIDEEQAKVSLELYAEMVEAIKEEDRLSENL